MKGVFMSKKSCRIAVELVIGACLIVAAYIWTAGRNDSIWPADRAVAKGPYRQVMGTFARVVAVGMDSEMTKACIETAFEKLQRVDNLMSDYKPDSQISKVNRDAFRQPVPVSEPVFEVLRRSVEFSKKSAGAFDVTVGPLVDLWRLAGEREAEPSEKELAEARAKVGYEKLILNDEAKTVCFKVDGMRLDLGGIAKGYAIDMAIEAMQHKGAIGGMVDIGGDIRCFGAPPEEKEKWAIGLQDPAGQEESVVGGPLVLVLELINEAVATSGGYRRFVLIGETAYSHIVDPGTSSSAVGLSSVTIIARSAMDADALATAVTVMGPEKGLALIEQMPDTEAIVITTAPEFKRIQSSRAVQYIRQ